MADRRGSGMVQLSGRETFLVAPVAAGVSIGLNTLCGVRNDDGFLEPYNPAGVAAAYAYSVVGIAVEHIDGGTLDGDVVTDKNVVFGGRLKMTANADLTALDLGKAVYGETESQAKVAAVVDGNVIGTVLEVLADGSVYVLIES